MLSEQDLIAYLENTLAPDERKRVEAELERAPQLRRQLVRQAQLDAALRAALGSDPANQRVKQSILAAIRTEGDEVLKTRILADTTDAGPQPSMWEWLAGWVRRPAFGWGFAAVLIAFVAWFAQRPATTRPGLELPTRVDLAGRIAPPKAGEIIRAGAASSATVKFADGTTLHLEPGTEISLAAVGSPRSGGKQIKLLTGSLSADVAKQPPGLPLLIQTPHALVTVVGTEFDLSVVTNQTALEVTHGLVKMTSDGESNAVSVAAGEFAVASPRGPMRYGRLTRNPFLWPFSSASIWNRPLGGGAQFAPVPRSFLDEGPLQNAMRPRRAVMGGPNAPLRGIWVAGKRLADARITGTDLAQSGTLDNVLLLQSARRHALELSTVSVRPDGDLEAAALVRTDLAGPGVSDQATAANPFGLSHLGGLVHAHELRQGIPHALACRVKRDRLGGRNNFQTPSTVWPAAGGDAAVGGNYLSIGSLLAIPPQVDIKMLLGASGPAYELARAMQDYGVYVTGYGDAPFVLLRADPLLTAAEEDAVLNQLVPLLEVVTNNTPQTPGGGGAPRREAAPALPGEAP